MSMSNNIGVPILKVNRNSDSFLHQNRAMSIGQRVREARKAAGLTQQQLAEKVGIKQSTLSELENGDSAGSGHLAAMAAALNVSALWLQTGKGSMRHVAPPTPPRSIGRVATTEEISELIALYGQSSPEWRQRIFDLAKLGAYQSSMGALPENQSPQ